METDVVEFTTWKVRAIGLKSHRPQISTAPSASQPAPIPSSRRPVYFRERGGMIDCPIYQGEQIAAGSSISGPAVVEEPTTTIYLPANARAVTDKSRNYFVTLDI
jgi:N-methylhydantoinase A